MPVGTLCHVDSSSTNIEQSMAEMIGMLYNETADGLVKERGESLPIHLHSCRLMR